jgi:DNA polymerase elongation subunit (family B)
MNVFIDIETIPAQGDSYAEFLAAAQSNFKAPSTLTKGQACDDLGLTGNDAKFTSKEDAIALWEKKFAEEKAPQVAEENWRKTSFDGSKGEIISIAWADEDERVLSMSRGLGESEAELLRCFFSGVRPIGSRRPPFFIGHYIGGFDLKFIYQRAVILGVDPRFAIPFDGRHDQHFYCTQQAWAGFNGRISQDNLCKALGIEGKPSDIDGSKVWDFVKAGRVAEVEAYNQDDVYKNRLIYNKLKFIG